MVGCLTCPLSKPFVQRRPQRSLSPNEKHPFGLSPPESPRRSPQLSSDGFSDADSACWRKAGSLSQIGLNRKS
jgi:hypothetical protein